CKARFLFLGVGVLLRNRALLAVSFAVCATYTGIGMVAPVRVLYAEERGASLFVIGAMGSSYLISNFLFQYPCGWLADRWGRKPMMILSLALQAIISATYLLITDPFLFILVRFGEGAVAAAFLPSSRAIITDAIPPEKRGEAFGIYSAFFNAGFLLGPALGGIIASTGYASAFIGAVLFRLVAIVIVITMIRVPAKSRESEQEKSAPVSLRELFAPVLVAAYIMEFVNYLFVGFDISLTPLWMHDHLNASVAMIGIAYMAWSITSIIAAPFGGRLADRRRRSTLILIFGLAQVPFYIYYGLASVAIIIVIVFALHGIAYSLMQPAIDAHLASASPPHARARAQGLYTAFGTFGGFVGASASSLLYSVNYRLPLLTIAGVFGIGILIGGTMIRHFEARGSTTRDDKEQGVEVAAPTQGTVLPG
ncbi:MAG TPA: MFS transporter, partial [Ktedonobacteraceae bacterium]|nr:MFS transporter [Ktedonobacteraceae bacterium]